MNKNIKDTQKEDQVVGKNNQQQDQIEAEVLETADNEGVSRTPRQARDDNQRADTQRTQAWQPPSVLPDPKPQDGYVFRWKLSQSGFFDKDLILSTPKKAFWVLK